MTYMTVCKAESSTFIKNCHVIKRILPFVTVTLCSFAAFSKTKNTVSKDALYIGFVTPPVAAKLRVWRHWINGTLPKMVLPKILAG